MISQGIFTDFATDLYTLCALFPSISIGLCSESLHFLTFSLKCHGKSGNGHGNVMDNV